MIIDHALKFSYSQHYQTQLSLRFPLPLFLMNITIDSNWPTRWPFLWSQSLICVTIVCAIGLLWLHAYTPEGHVSARHQTYEVRWTWCPYKHINAGTSTRSRTTQSKVHVHSVAYSIQDSNHTSTLHVLCKVTFRSNSKFWTWSKRKDCVYLTRWPWNWTFK